MQPGQYISNPKFQARCKHCGYIGDRVFGFDKDLILRDVLGGDRGITPNLMIGSPCGGCGDATEFEMVLVPDEALYIYDLVRVLIAEVYKRGLTTPTPITVLLHSLAEEVGALKEPPTGTSEAASHMVQTMEGRPQEDHNRTLMYYQKQTLEGNEDGTE